MIELYSKKRVIALLLTSCLLIPTVPFSANAQDSSMKTVTSTSYTEQEFNNTSVLEDVYDVTNSVYASDVTKEEAIAAALLHVASVQQIDEESAWSGHNVEASVPIEVYDASNELHSYIVNLEIDGTPSGFVEIANNSADFPVISFSEESQIMNSSEEKSLTKEVRAVSKGKKEKLLKVITFGPGRVGLKVDYKDGSANLATSEEIKSITAVDNKPVTKTKDTVNEGSKEVWKQIEQIAEDYSTGDIGSSSDGVTDEIKESGYDSVNSYSIYGVGDANQSESDLWDGPSGCAPTSAYNVMYYWHYEKGYKRLLKNDSGDGYVDKNEAIALMRDLMNTDDNGNTYISKQDNAMEDFADEKGYNASSVLHSDPSWSTVKNDIKIGPSLLSFLDQDFYGDHTVVGVGYKEYSYDGSTAGHRYMKVHDNWDTTVKNVYIAWDRDYDTMYSCNFEI